MYRNKAMLTDFDKYIMAVRAKAKMMYDIDLSEDWLKGILPEVMKSEPTIRSAVLYLAYKYDW
jgi:hypothetical protein